MYYFCKRIRLIGHYLSVRSQMNELKYRICGFTKSDP